MSKDRRRDRLTKAGIWSASLTGHLIFFLLVGLVTPGVRRVMIEEEAPPLIVDIYRPPPRPREVRPPLPKKELQPEKKTTPPRPAPPEMEPFPTPQPQPQPAPKPVPKAEPIRQAPPIPTPAPPRPRETPREAPAKPSPAKPREVDKQAPPSPIAPLPMAPVARPAAPSAPAAPSSGGGGGGTPLPNWGVKPGGDLRDALRGSSPGCGNRTAVGLNRRERESCEERLGEGAKDADYISGPMGREKRDRFDATAGRKQANREWKEAPVPPGIDPKAAPGVLTGLGNPSD